MEIHIRRDMCEKLVFRCFKKSFVLIDHISSQKLFAEKASFLSRVEIHAACILLYTVHLCCIIDLCLFVFCFVSTTPHCK